MACSAIIANGCKFILERNLDAKWRWQVLHERWRERADKDRCARARARELVLVYDIYIAHLLEVRLLRGATGACSLYRARGVCFFCGLHVARPRLKSVKVALVISKPERRSRRRASFSLALPTANARTAHHIIQGTTRRRSSLRPLRRRRSEKMADNWTQSVVCR